MLGIVWGIVAVALLIAYGASFRSIMVGAFDAFGQSVIIAWPGQTSEQAGGERAGRRIRLEQADVDAVLNEVSLIKSACLESTNWRSITYQERLTNSPVRGVCAAYGEMRNEVPAEGRWITRRRYARAPPGRVHRLRGPQEAVQRTAGGRRDHPHRRDAVHRDRRDGQEDPAQQLLLERR